jgi:addiction module RelE/StbE family toxin
MPAAFRVIVLSEAVADIDHITEYIRQDSPQNAFTVFNRLWEAGQSLSTFPNRFSIYEDQQDRTKAVRAMPVPPFIIYYRVDESSRTVRILAVRDARRRQPTGFP